MNLRYFGVGDLAADLNDIPDTTINVCGWQGMHLRARLDLRVGMAAYRPRIWNLAQRGITLLPILMWSTSDGKWRPPNDDASRASWKSFCQDYGYVQRECYLQFGYPSGDQVELWNEPNLPLNGGLTPEAYIRDILKPGREGLKQWGGPAIIVGGLAFGNNGGRMDASDFIRGLYNTNGHNWSGYFDAIAIHPYGKTHPTTFTSERWENQSVARAQQEVVRAIGARSGSEPLIVSETGRSSAIFGETAQRDFASQLVPWLRSQPSVAGISWWHLHDTGSPPVEYLTGMHRPDWSAKPAWSWYWPYVDGQGRPFSSFPVDP